MNKNKIACLLLSIIIMLCGCNASLVEKSMQIPSSENVSEEHVESNATSLSGISTEINSPVYEEEVIECEEQPYIVFMTEEIGQHSIIRKFGVERNGVVVVPAIYSSIKILSCNQYAVVEIEDMTEQANGGGHNYQRGMINMHNEVIIPIIYYHLYLGDEAIAVQLRDYNDVITSALLSFNNEIILPFQEAEIHTPHNGMFIIRRNNLFGFISEDGRIVVEPIFDDVIEFGQDVDYTIVFIHRKILSRQRDFPGVDMEITFRLFQYAIVNIDGELAYQCPYVFIIEGHTIIPDYVVDFWPVTNTHFPSIVLPPDISTSRRMIDINGYFGSTGRLSNTTKHRIVFGLTLWGEYQGFPMLEVIEWNDNITYELRAFE